MKRSSKDKHILQRLSLFSVFKNLARTGSGGSVGSLDLDLLFCSWFQKLTFFSSLVWDIKFRKLQPGRAVWIAYIFLSSLKVQSGQFPKTGKKKSKINQPAFETDYSLGCFDSMNCFNCCSNHRADTLFEWRYQRKPVVLLNI
jgi:hypothetical protein